MIDKINQKINFYKKIDEFSEYFINDKKNNFIYDFKLLIKSYIDCYDQNIISSKGNYLYEYSNSYIYYPKKIKINNLSKNILIVAHELSRTGAPVVAVDTAKLLFDNGYFVTVISPKGGPLLDELIEYGIPVIIIKNMKYPQYMRQDICNYFDKLDLDMFVDSFDITIMVTATLYNFVKRYFNTKNKIIWWIHEGHESYNILGQSMPKNITSNIRVFCGGKYAVKKLMERGFNYYPEVLNYGVIDKGCKKNININNKKIVFMLAGTIGKRKGQLILLDAIKQIPENMKKNTEFIFVGDPYESDIEGQNILAELKNYEKDNSNVKVLPSMNRDDLYKLYQKIDVLVLASIDDPMPVVATENLMLGNICLCSNETGTSYYINDSKNGFVFQSGDSSQLLYKIIYILQNQEHLSKIKIEGRKIYEDYFEMNVFENNLLKIIEEELKK